MERMTQLTRRVDRLERENRRLKRMLLIALVLFASTVLMSQVVVETRPVKLEAQTIEVKDMNGNPRGVFGVAEDGSASLKLLDESGAVVWSTP